MSTATISSKIYVPYVLEVVHICQAVQEMNVMKNFVEDVLKFGQKLINQDVLTSVESEWNRILNFKDGIIPSKSEAVSTDTEGHMGAPHTRTKLTKPHKRKGLHHLDNVELFFCRKRDDRQIYIFGQNHKYTELYSGDTSHRFFHTVKATMETNQVDFFIQTDVRRSQHSQHSHRSQSSQCSQSSRPQRIQQTQPDKLHHCSDLALFRDMFSDRIHRTDIRNMFLIGHHAHPTVRMNAMKRSFQGREWEVAAAIREMFQFDLKVIKDNQVLFDILKALLDVLKLAVCYPSDETKASPFIVLMSLLTDLFAVCKMSRVYKHVPTRLVFIGGAQHAQNVDYFLYRTGWQECAAQQLVQREGHAVQVPSACFNKDGSLRFDHDVPASVPDLSYDSDIQFFELKQLLE